VAKGDACDDDMREIEVDAFSSNILRPRNSELIKRAIKIRHLCNT
jgi:hypothetical protein